MKATKYWKSNGIPFKPMAVTFYITKNHITCAIVEILDWNNTVRNMDGAQSARYPDLKKGKITKKSVEEKIKYNLMDRGNVWEEYHGDNNFSNELYKEAEKIGKRLFPSFWEDFKNASNH